MINLNEVAPTILKDLRARGHTDEQIQKMNWNEAFDEYCEWNGLVNWGSQLREVMKQLKNAQDAAPPTPPGFWG